MTTATVTYRRERLGRGWLDLCQYGEGGGWGLAWNPDYAEPDWPGHTYSPEDDDLPGDYPDPPTPRHSSNGGGSTSAPERC